MSKMLDLSIIIPAYNEEKKIKKDIFEAKQFLEIAALKGEIIVSTDGVTDKTNLIVKNLQKRYKNLHLLSDIKKTGKGAAIKKGVMVAQGKIIMFADAGLCVPYNEALKGIALIKDGSDCAMGSRAEKKSKVLKKQPIYRQLGSQLFGIIIRSIIGIPREIKDTQCGFKLYKNKVAKEVYKELRTKAMAFDIEIILRLKKKKYRIQSFPVEWKNDIDTKFNPLNGSIEILQDLLLMKTSYKL